MSTDRYWVLLAKKKSGEATPEELNELSALSGGESEESPAHEVLDRVWVAPMETVPETYLHRNVWYRIQKSVYMDEAGRGRIAGWGKWAVAASILVLSMAGGWYLLPSGQRAPIAQSGTGGQTMNQVATQTGSKTRVELPDGTQVWLNANSQISYGNRSFGVEERQVTLTGEAYFDVARNEKLPFIIHTRDITIRVLGTAFTVRAYPRERTVETSLIRGMVSITTRQDPERSIILKPAEKLIVPVDTSMEEDRRTAPAIAAAGSPYSIVRLKKDTAVEIVWTRNKLEFDNETLEQLAPKLEIWYHISIHFADAAVRKRRFSGVIEKETITQTLDAMKLSGHFEYQLKENDLWLREN